MCDIKVTDDATVSQKKSFNDCIQLLVKRHEESREHGHGLSYNDLSDDIFEQVCRQKGLILGPGVWLRWTVVVPSTIIS